jgi:hypothetical protein
MRSSVLGTGAINSDRLPALTPRQMNDPHHSMQIKVSHTQIHSYFLLLTTSHPQRPSQARPPSS